MILQVLIAMVAGWLQRHQQQVIAHLLAENRVLKAQLGGRRLRLTDTERHRLATLAYPLGRTHLKEVATIATPDTLLRWYKRLIAQKCDGSKQRRQCGRPRVAEEVEQLVGRMAKENPTWGYRRILGALANLGHQIDTITVRNILRRHHLEPAPQRRKAGMSWQQFLKIHWEVLAATDFFTVEVATWHGLVTYYVLVVMELITRRVHMAGFTPYPTDAFMEQCARQLTDPFDGFLLDEWYLIHDWDEKFVHGFDRILRASGMEPVVLPPRSANLNAHCERFVRSSSSCARAVRALDHRGSAQSDDRDRRGVAQLCHPVVPEPLPSREKSPRSWEPAHCPRVGCGESTWVSLAWRATRWVAELLSSRGGVTRRIISTLRGAESFMCWVVIYRKWPAP